MTYNIFEGAKETLPHIIEMINAEQPDYLALNEANTFSQDGNKVLRTFADATQMPFYDISLSGKEDYHVAILSRYPLKNVQRLESFQRACIAAEISTDMGLISVASLHLSPYAEDIRVAEIERVAAFQKPYSNKVLMGDFNALSAQDEYGEDLIASFNHKQAKKFTQNGRFHFEAIGRVLESGYIDVGKQKGKEAESTVPTPANRDETHASLRLDYIFISQALVPHLRSYEVVKNEKTDLASVHYPVVAILE